MHRFPLHEALIDLAAITHNVDEFLKAREARSIALDIRADAYGHGAVEVARAAAARGVAGFVVSTAEEAAQVKDAGIRVPSVVASGDDPGVDLGVTVMPTAAAYGFGRGEWRAGMRVLARVIGVKQIRQGEGVSYGYTYRAPRETHLALVAIGYANGVDRLGSNIGSLWLRGAPRPIAGRIAMNALVVELGDDQAEVGDTAVLFGATSIGEPHISDWAGAIGKRAEEIAANLGAHLPRSYA